MVQPNANDCSLVNTNFRALTPDVIEGMNMTAYTEDIFARMIESRAVGVVPDTWHELLMSRIAERGKDSLMKRSAGRTTQFAPYNYRWRKRNTRLSPFNIVSGAAHPQAGVGAVPASAWQIVVNTGPSPYATPFKNLARFFLDGLYLSVEHHNQQSLVAYRSAHQIYAKEDIDESTARVTIVAPYTNAEWAALSALNKKKFQPTFGSVNLLSNNVSDYENYCPTPPADMAKELILDPIQTSRETRARSQNYIDALKNIMAGNVNPFLREFRNLPEAERNKLEFEYWQRVWSNAVLFNDRISQAQKDDPTWADIEALPAVTDIEDAGCILDRKANALGVITQLTNAGRRIDVQGGNFPLDLLLEQSEEIRRNRQLDGGSHETIDWWVDKYTKDQWDMAFSRYLKDKYDYMINRYITPGQVVVDGTKIVMFEYTVYDIPHKHLRIGVFTHRFFDDRLLGFTDGTNGSVNNRNRGRMAFAPDWSDLQIGLFETNSVKREFNNNITAQADINRVCRMKLNTKYYDMRSFTWNVEIGDYSRWGLFENFNDACPALTARVCQPLS